MKIPKYIDKLLDRRARYAMLFMDMDYEVSKWLKKNNIEVSNDDVSTGACALLEPYSSIDSIRECIREKE